MQQYFNDSLGYLISQVCKHHRGKANDLLSEIGLFTGQEMIIMYLHNYNNITQSKLVKAMGVKPATITKVLKRMEKNGYLSRKKDEKDARIMRISLTDKGNKIINKISNVWHQLDSITFDGLTNEELVIMRRILIQIVKNFENSTYSSSHPSPSIHIKG